MSVESSVSRGFVDTVDLEPGFDAVVVMGNFQLHADPRATLRHLARVAAPRAALYLDSKNPLSSTRRVARRLMTTPAKSVPPVNAFAAHAFHGLRVALTQKQLESELERSGWEVCEMRTTAPRLLRFGNTHKLGRGLKGRVWRGFDRVDRLTGERAWIQISARRNPQRT